MRRSIVPLLLGAFLLGPGEALAGMPSVHLTEWANLRFSAISFFTLAFLLLSGVIWGLWNTLARDFPALPRLTYRRSLAVVALWSLMLLVVLTMIAGSRELLTPGAWQRQGALYKVADPEPVAAQPNPVPTRDKPTGQDERRNRLRELQAALWHYAALHGGRFPAKQDDPAIPPKLWEIPGAGHQTRFFYVPDKTADNTPGILVYEPELSVDEGRLVLTTAGQIDTLMSAEIRRRLEEKKP